MKIGFGILLEDEAFNFVRSIELELFHKFGLLRGIKQPPHITIKSPFYTDKVEPFYQYLKDLSKRIKPFEIKLEGFGHFEKKVIFLNVKENPFLKKLHLKIIKELKEKFDVKPSKLEGKSIKFHSTIALKDFSEKEFKKIKKYLTRKYKPSLRFKARRIGIFYYLGQHNWIVIKTVKFNF